MEAVILPGPTTTCSLGIDIRKASRDRRLVYLIRALNGISNLLTRRTNITTMIIEMASYPMFFKHFLFAQLKKKIGKKKMIC